MITVRYPIADLGAPDILGLHDGLRLRLAGAILSAAAHVPAAILERAVGAELLLVQDAGQGMGAAAREWVEENGDVVDAVLEAEMEQVGAREKMEGIEALAGAVGVEVEWT